MFSSSDLITRTWQYCAKENKTNLSEYARTRDISQAFDKASAIGELTGNQSTQQVC